MNLTQEAPVAPEVKPELTGKSGKTKSSLFDTLLQPAKKLRRAASKDSSKEVTARRDAVTDKKSQGSLL